MYCMYLYLCMYMYMLYTRYIIVVRRQAHTHTQMYLCMYWGICGIFVCNCMYFLFDSRSCRSLVRVILAGTALARLELALASVELARVALVQVALARVVLARFALRLDKAISSLDLALVSHLVLSFPFPFPFTFSYVTRKISTKSYMNRFVCICIWMYECMEYMYE